jgi:trehalose 6-phosphate phosphatase
MYSKSDLTTWARSAACLWLFLDYDGTLEEFAPSPFDIYPNPEIIQILEKLAARSNIRITVLSGRSLEHIRQLVPVRGIFLAGSYGIELLTPAQETIHRLKFEAIRPLLEEIKPGWAELIRGKRGFFLEDKGWTLAIHARFADDLETEQVIRNARETDGLSSLLPHFRIVGGHKFLEIAPRMASKGEAVTHLLQMYPFANAQLLYIGDDDKDEEAFPVIHARGGLTVKVLQPSQWSQPSEANMYFANPGETLEWLKELV